MCFVKSFSEGDVFALILLTTTLFRDTGGHGSNRNGYSEREDNRTIQSFHPIVGVQIQK